MIAEGYTQAGPIWLGSESVGTRTWPQHAYGMAKAAAEPRTNSSCPVSVPSTQPIPPAKMKYAYSLAACAAMGTLALASTTFEVSLRPAPTEGRLSTCSPSLRVIPTQPTYTHSRSFPPCSLPRSVVILLSSSPTTSQTLGGLLPVPPRMRSLER